MTKEVPELLLLDASQNYRERFEARFNKYSPDEQRETVRALMECAAGLSKHLGHMPDNICFGRDVFSKEKAERLVSGLYKLQAQAEERSFEVGLTAVLALQAVASLVMVAHVSKSPSIRARRERELSRMGKHMEAMYSMHLGSAAQ